MTTDNLPTEPPPDKPARVSMFTARILTYAPMQPGAKFIAEFEGYPIQARSDTASGAARALKKFRAEALAKIEAREAKAAAKKAAKVRVEP